MLNIRTFRPDDTGAVRLLFAESLMDFAGTLDRCGSLAQGRKDGLLRSEGKTYPVKDGDVINFLVSA